MQTTHASAQTDVEALFLAETSRWYEQLPSTTWKEVITEADGADHVAVMVVDMVRGFATEGALSSPRVQAIAAPIAAALSVAHELGVEAFYEFCDQHEPEAREFGAYAPHCVQGSSESELVPELASLPFAAQCRLVGKNSLSAVWAGDWLQEAAERYRRFVVVGDCTDLCILNLAMPLKLYRDQHQLDFEVVVPAALVQTFDGPGHPGDLLHRLALYYMASNGVQVVADLTA